MEHTNHHAYYVYVANIYAWIRFLLVFVMCWNATKKKTHGKNFKQIKKHNIEVSCMILRICCSKLNKRHEHECFLWLNSRIYRTLWFKMKQDLIEHNILIHIKPHIIHYDFIDRRAMKIGELRCYKHHWDKECAEKSERVRVNKYK